MTFEHGYIFIKQDGLDVELVMPPMDEQAKLDQKRCINYWIELFKKYWPLVKAEMENEAASNTLN